MLRLINRVDVNVINRRIDTWDFTFFITTLLMPFLYNNIPILHNIRAIVLLN